MRIIGKNFKKLENVNIKLIYCLKIFPFLMLFLIAETDSIEAQEYATDRLFMNQYKKAKCRNEAEKKIRKIKTLSELTLEHQVLLIQNVWVKLRSNLPLSNGEKKLLKNLKEKGFVSKKMRSKEILKNKSAQFKEIRMKCKQIR